MIKQNTSHLTELPQSNINQYHLSGCMQEHLYMVALLGQSAQCRQCHPPPLPTDNIQYFIKQKNCFISATDCQSSDESRVRRLDTTRITCIPLTVSFSYGESPTSYLHYLPLHRVTANCVQILLTDMCCLRLGGGGTLRLFMMRHWPHSLTDDLACSHVQACMARALPCLETINQRPSAKKDFKTYLNCYVLCPQWFPKDASYTVREIVCLTLLCLHPQG